MTAETGPAASIAINAAFDSGNIVVHAIDGTRATLSIRKAK